ncbi:hypothetical protein RFI_26616 [Reticulomyxa filosa]|uniref:RRM domain-containing protein n=1 Tax=Reticulomyxa filosa TaxID=46433 RepID=X6MAT0_RETFI|nr:hypothetical protein RFI_26616 [Reticulomyxa filosa]|eukprot:ETO10761.1 hypothetical protein RFI_26616 [Reticulomyxa filosa]
MKDDLGRPSGEGFVELESTEDLAAAIAKNRFNMGRRYIELFQSSAEELMKRTEFAHSNNSYRFKRGFNQNRRLTQKKRPQSSCLLMRGLPYSCTEVDITKFFQEAHITPLRIHRKADGAEAYVEFYSPADCSTAMTRNRVLQQYTRLLFISFVCVSLIILIPFFFFFFLLIRDQSFIGPRHIELFRVSYEGMARTVGLSLYPKSEASTSETHFELIPNISQTRTQEIPTSYQK